MRCVHTSSKVELTKINYFESARKKKHTEAKICFLILHFSQYTITISQCLKCYARDVSKS